MLKHKYIYSILQQNKFNTINIKFKFTILEEALMNENKDTKIWIPLIWKKWIASGNSSKFSTFTPEIWIVHMPAHVPLV